MVVKFTLKFALEFALKFTQTYVVGKTTKKPQRPNLCACQFLGTNSREDTSIPPGAPVRIQSIPPGEADPREDIQSPQELKLQLVQSLSLSELLVLTVASSSRQS